MVSTIADLPHPLAPAVIVKHDPNEIAEAWYHEYEDDEYEESGSNNGDNDKSLRKNDPPTHTISYYDEDNHLVAVNIYDNVEKAVPIRQCIVQSSYRGQNIIPRELQRRLGGEFFLP